MKSLAWIPVAIAATLALGLAPRDDSKPKGDLGKLQGKWTAKVGPNHDIPIVVEIKGKEINVLIRVPDQEEKTLKGRIDLDEKKSPKEIDLIGFTGPDGNEIADNKGIYELEGDRWKVCNGGPGNDRPKDFTEEGERRLVNLSRLKDQEKGN